MLDTLIIEISKYNTGDDSDLFINRTKYRILYSLSEFSGDSKNAFVITDSRAIADKAVRDGIGFSVYINEQNRLESFQDSLYCIESINDIEDDTIYKIYLRNARRPWTIIETDRYLIREITLDDIDALYELYSDEEVKKYTEDLYKEKEREIEFTKNYIDYQYKFFEYGFWLVFDKGSNELIGRCGLSDREGFDTTELGFIFAKKCWGKGIAFEICTKIMEYAKENLEMSILLSFTKKENIRAIKLLERLGFSYAGNETIDSLEYMKYEKSL